MCTYGQGGPAGHAAVDLCSFIRGDRPQNFCGCTQVTDGIMRGAIPRQITSKLLESLELTWSQQESQLLQRPIKGGESGTTEVHGGHYSGKEVCEGSSVHKVV